MSVGHPQHASLLLRLLLNAQRQCRSLRAVNTTETIVVVHVCPAEAYDRSSFQLAGQQYPIVAVASMWLAKGAIQDLLPTLPRYQQHQVASRRRPFIRIVDHVAIMPVDETNHTVHF